MKTGLIGLFSDDFLNIICCFNYMAKLQKTFQNHKHTSDY
jgi:hypothetical protein